MSLILSWVLFPVLVAAVGAGWGALVERAAGQRMNGVLLLPLGLATAIVVASLLTAFSATAPAATPLVAVGAVAGLVIARPFRRITLWPALTAVGVLLVYGAPVLLSGSATFLGFTRLDDTATWFALTDHVMTHGRSLSDLPVSSYQTLLKEYVSNNYPLGGFMLLGVGHLLTGIETAWIFQPYLACCGAAIGLGVYALVKPVVSSQRLCALVAFLAAQPALLYGYSLWGGIKEMTAAFLLVLGAALLAPLILERPDNPRRLLGVAITAAALIVTLGPGAAAWVVPALIGVVIVWVIRARRDELWSVARGVGLLSVTTAVLALPMWVVLSSFLEADSNLFSAGQPKSEKLGNLLEPLSGWQIAGIWPVGDFRYHPPTVATVLLIALALLSAALAIWLTVRSGRFTIAAYVAIALVGCAVYYLVGSTPCVIAKSFAIASPALLAAALVGGALLWSRRRAGLIVLVLIGGGVLWSNTLAYSDATLAPRARLAELQHIGGLVAGKGPTFINEYDVYANADFLRAGAPTGPAEYRPLTLPMRSGESLTESAWADIDSFPLSTLEPYRSIVTRRSPAESRPPSIYQLVWQGAYYQLWQRPAVPSTRVLEHVPLGESNALPYCGSAEHGAPTEPLCSANPVAIPPCSQIRTLGLKAQAQQAQLVAHQRAAPIVVRADETVWPDAWIHQAEERALIPTTPGQVVAHIAVASTQTYELWLDGDFARGFIVSVDGRHVGRVRNALAGFGGLRNGPLTLTAGFTGYVHVANLPLTSGVHTFVLSYPHTDLAPGGADSEFTSLAAITLQPESPPSELISVPPAQATQLCGRPLDWIEIVS